MIVGTGLDLVEVARIEKAVKIDRFYTKNFTQTEIDLFTEKKHNAQTVAGNFAAKEAVLKSIGHGIFDIALIDIEVLRMDSGQPYVVLHGKAKEIADEQGVSTIHITITHIAQLAAAQAIAEAL